MTREEHISNLETIGCDGWTVTTEAYKSLQFAIKSLEQEPCEDAISRQQAISAIRNLYPGSTFVKLNLKKWQEENKKYFECENIINALPSVTHTRKKGKWEIGYSFQDGEYVKCTVCGEIIKCTYPMHYCPNCGAEMESEE